MRYCLFFFSLTPSQVNNHIDVCLSNHANPSFSKILYNTNNKEEFYYVWSKFVGENGKSVWKQEKRQFFSNGSDLNFFFFFFQKREFLKILWIFNFLEKINEIVNLSPEVIKTKGFEEKQIWFKFQLETLRIPWTQGADPILITKENVINDTLNFINLCDMHKVRNFWENLENNNFCTKGD